MTFKKNQPTYIAPSKFHRLAKSCMIRLEIIEAQSVINLGEDYVAFFEDPYGWAKS